MTDALYTVDSTLFVTINQSLANPVTDFLMPIITNDWVLRIMLAVALLMTLWKGTARLRWAALFSLIAVALADQAASTVIKPLFERMRPCHETAVFANLHLLVHCGGGKSFPSAHASNAFSIAVFFAAVTLRPKYTWVIWALFSFAALVALSRVFVGVHYPADILAGALVGSVCGLIAVAFLRMWYRKLRI